MDEQTWTMRTSSFTDENGQEWDVVSERAMRQRVDGWTARAESVRTFARRVNDGVEVDVEAGCSFQCSSAVRAFNQR